MQGDITRSTFRPENHYDGVRMQQGRVQLDADWNEQVDIQQYRDHIIHADVIGSCGAPKEGGGFALEVQNGAPAATAGRIYVDGILCENEGENGQAVALTAQPDLPGFTLPADPALYLAFLDVWQRDISALDDPHIREVALGGPDTATRSQVVWQIKLLEVGGENATATCKDDFPAFNDLTGATSGTLTARAQPETGTPNPCVVPPGAGYRRVENQLYRVEIHQGGPVGTATFKWSRENGSIATGWTAQNVNDLTVGTPGRDSVLGFAGGQWIELTDDSHELYDDTQHPTGRPGTLVKLLKVEGQVLTIDPSTAIGSVQFGDFPNNPKIRRWDQPSGSAGALTVEIPATNDGFIALEDGVEVKFEAGATYRAGDYWLIPARTITGDIDWPRDSTNAYLPQPPNGIRHHYCRLALVRFTAEAWQVVEDCRPHFPSLTTICAEDICFDNTQCQMVDVVTVQDALERLCGESDLRFHNKHLHGWGIVCGLRVTCGPDDEGAPRTHVTVHPGYAIDCEGDDIRLDEDATLDILRMIQILQDRNPNDPILDENGNGEVSMILGLNEARQHLITIEKFRPPGNNFQSLIAGTMLLDVYNDCVKPIQDFLREQLTPPPDEENLPAGPGTQRVAALSNLLAQGINPQTGQRLFISRREDAILRDFYTRLRALLQSETFCAMFENARPFPDYPPELDQMDTIFAKGEHTRLRLRPGGHEVYSVGAGANPLKPATTINRFDLDRNVLRSQIDPIAGTETGNQTRDTGTAASGDSGAGAVQDVAFSPNGNRIYMIAPTRNEENTFFRVGDFDRSGNLTWRPIVTICGVKLITLGTTAADPNNVYAVGVHKVSVTQNGTTRTQIEGLGLYKINPDNVDPNMAPVKPFNSVGHLVITADGRAFATAAPPNTEATAYQAILGIQLPALTPIFPNRVDTFAVDSGNDDIAVFTRAEGAERETIYVVTGPSQGTKAVQAFDMTGQRIGNPVTVLNTVVRLQTFAPTRMLLMSWEDDYSVRMIDMRSNQIVPNYLLPMQVSPIAITADAARAQRVYVLNYFSNTLTTANGALFRPEFRFPLAILAAYRKGAVEAFADLTAGFLQYLKDCLCDHFLINCPECTGQEKLYLGAVSIRARQVYKICNFTGRKTVGSFPTWGYWLSLVPIMPMIDRMIEQFCCTVLPDIFRYTAPAFDEQQTFNAKSRVQGNTFRSGLGAAQGADLGAWMRNLFNKGQATGNVLNMALRQPQLRAGLAAPTIMTSDIVGQPADDVANRLKDSGIEVQRAPFDPTSAPALAADLGAFFREPAPGSAVTLHEEDGKVVYYSVAATNPATQELRARVGTLSDSLQAKDAEIQQVRTTVEGQQTTLGQIDTLKTSLADAQTLLEQRDHELETLRGQVADLQRVQTELTTAANPDRVKAIEAELEDLRSFRTQVTQFMQQRPPR
jgi:hypothetical protein